MQRRKAMIKILFENAEELLGGIEEIKRILNIEPVSEGYDFRITAKQAEDKAALRVSLKNKDAVIEYGERAAFFRGLMLVCKNAGNDAEINEKRNFKTNGAMFDMSRNSVLKTETVIEIMRYMALMGLNMFMLYTEDNYEVEGYEYFGHMRGKYTKDDIKKIEAVGDKLGIELIPCIQLLGHLSTALRWNAFSPIRDTHDILMADNEDTYKFIDSVLKGISESFKSRRVHIGMDESSFLGCGKYLKSHEYADKSEIFCRHLNKCREIANSYGLRPMMWSDMFFDMAGEFGYSPQADFSDTVKSSVPKDVEQVFWAYNSSDKSEYEAMIEKHREITDNVIFAGGIWTWASPCPKYTKTINASRAALTACIDKNVSEVIATIWHNGAECPLVLSLPGLMMFAEMDYTGDFNVEAANENFKFISGVDANDIIDMDIADHPAGDDRGGINNPTRYLLANDPLSGLVDKHAEGLSLTEFYGSLADRYEKIGPRDGFFFEAFEYYRALMRLLEAKADFGLKLKAAYDKRDVEALKAHYEWSFEVEKRVSNLHAVHRKSWLYYNKANGFEVFDMIYGAMISRMQTLRYQLDRFFEDESYVIDELAEDRLPFAKIPDKSLPTVYIPQRFTRIYSANVVFTVYNDMIIG